ncbi:MAG: ATP-dependent protease [Deltaproteobacteria bacterium]|nr:MAG: ATP-dependent protease [Deltaproteobacteria bacterium]
MAIILKPDDLYRSCDPKVFTFRTTGDHPGLEGIIGQRRALDAIDFGLNLQSSGFNIYVLGDSGTGKTSAIRTFISRKADTEIVPPDWCYVFNFAEAAEPIAVWMEPGRGVEFQKDMEALIDHLKVEIPKIFESKEYKRQKAVYTDEFQGKQKELFGALEKEAESRGFKIKSAMGGFSIVAIGASGDALTEEEYNTFDQKRKDELRENGKSIQERLDDVMRLLKKEEKETGGKLNELERIAALSVLGHLIEDIKSQHPNNGKLQAYLDAAREDILKSIEDFKAPQEEPPSPLPFLKMQKQEPNFSRYSVNVLVNNGGGKGSPCVFESNPTYYNLFGRIEHKLQIGAAITDFTMIKAGALHKANGGYLVVNALDLLRNIFSYDALKRAIRNREVKIEDVWEQYRLVTTTTMKPEPIPLDVKVILIGTPEIYYLLYNLDEEYRELFKVKADFDNRIERTEANIREYAAFVATKTREERLLPFDASGVARVVEYGSRLAEHQEKLSSKFSDVSNLIRESHYWARKADADVVSGRHVEKALEEKVHRHSRIEDRMRDVTAEGTIIVETSGEAIGQVNGLSVLDTGDYSFGRPSRITATVHAGKRGVVNIERETKLSGKIHEKAVLILSSYLGRKYASRKPISLTASLTFEQLYGMIEGDSATCAELYALLSAIAGVPIRQGIAVTGSMDQNGTVQPIGGANEKIEGFFDLCRLRGLTGEQGVILPMRNARNLMLKKEVVEAVREGKFRIYAIEHVEDGVEILTGIPAGKEGPDGTYPAGTLNRLVEERLTALRNAMKGEEEGEKRKDRED